MFLIQIHFHPRAQALWIRPGSVLTLCCFVSATIICKYQYCGSNFWNGTYTVHTSTPTSTFVRWTVEFNAKVELIKHHHLLPLLDPPDPPPLQLRTLSDINLPAACAHRYRSKVNKATFCPAVTGASNSFCSPVFVQSCST